MIEQVGEVEGVYPDEAKLDEQFLVRKDGRWRAGDDRNPRFPRISRLDPRCAGRRHRSGSKPAGRHYSIAQRRGALLKPGKPNSAPSTRCWTGSNRVPARLRRRSTHLRWTWDGLREEWSSLKAELRKLPPKSIPTIDSITGTWNAITGRSTEAEPIYIRDVVVDGVVGRQHPAREGLLVVAVGKSSPAKLTGQMFAGPAAGTLRHDPGRDPRGRFHRVLAATVPALPADRRIAVLPRARLAHRTPARQIPGIDPDPATIRNREENHVGHPSAIRPNTLHPGDRQAQRASYAVLTSSASNARRNSAEHSWHLAVMAMTLEEHANEAVDIGRVIQMALLHDVVEVDAGDVLLLRHRGVRGERREGTCRGGSPVWTPPFRSGAGTPRSLGGIRGPTVPRMRSFAAALDRLMPLMHKLPHERSRVARNTAFVERR